MRLPPAWSFILWSAPGMAQSWCAPGALWFHEYPYTSSGDHGYVETRYTGNVLFADSVCEAFSIVEHGWSDQTNTPWEGGPFTMHTHTAEDGLIHIWDGSAFDTLFHFGAAPGDHWQFPTGWAESGTRITVTDTGHAMISNTLLRYLTVEATLEDIVFVADTIFERIGPIALYIDILNTSNFLIDGGYGGLRCYEDDEISISRVEGPCEIALNLVEAHEHGTSFAYPNPCSTTLTLQWNSIDPPVGLLLIDVLGRQAKFWSLRMQSGSPTMLDVSDVAPGQYLLRSVDHDVARSIPVHIQR